MSQVPALQRGIEIISKIAVSDYTYSQLESEMGIPKASFGRLMKCLLDNNFIVADKGSKLLRIGDNLMHLSMESYESSPVWRYGHESARKLSERWKITCVIHEHKEPFEIFWRVKSVPPGGINTRAVGFSMSSMNSNSQGQLFLSQMPDLAIKDYFAAGQLRKASEFTIMDYDSMLVRIQEIRECGYALQEKENHAFMKQISVPFKLPGDKGRFCMTAYMPLDFADVLPLRDNMLFEAARVGGIE